MRRLFAFHLLEGSVFSMSPSRDISAPRSFVRLKGWRRFAMDGFAMLVYLAICYCVSLAIGPLGRDYAGLADPASLPWGIAQVVSWEAHAFARVVAGYHLINIVLLYACMLVVYRMTQLAIRGPAWLGTLAATLFMANPVHSEAVLNLTGVSDLLPCLAALLAVTVYMEHAARPRLWSRLLWLPVMVAAVVSFRENVWLILFAPLYEACLPEKEARHWRRAAVATACTFAVSLAHASEWMPQDLSLSGMFAPLYFVFYPIGFLPENAFLFHQQPYLGWLAAVAALGVTGLLVRKTRHPALTFGLLAMAATQLGQGARLVDPVHLVGGGRLLLACAFYHLALSGLCHRMLKHPKWPRTVVLATTILCVVFFILQVQSVLKWQEASRIAREFRDQAQAWKGPRTVLPDFRYYDGAPLCLSESIAYDTPFGRAVPHVAPLQLDVPDEYPPSFSVKAVDESTYEVAIHAKHALNAIPWPYTLAGTGSVIDKDETRIETITRAPESITFRVTSKLGAFPAR